MNPQTNRKKGFLTPLSIHLFLVVVFQLTVAIGFAHNACIENLAARAKQGKIQITWTPVPNTAQFNISRSVSMSGPYASIGSVPGTQSIFLDKLAQTGVVNYYQIQRVPNDGSDDCLSAIIASFASTKRERLTVIPEISGQDRTTALNTLEGANLNVKTQEESSDTVPLDFAIATDPPPGSSVPQGFEVTLFISNGQTNTTPVVTIIFPEDGLEFQQGDQILLEGTAFDSEDGDLTGPPPETELLGPTPYLSIEDSPLLGEIFSYFHLEDFEDGGLNTPGVLSLEGVVLDPSEQTDSVDADDGTIDGDGTAGFSFSSNDRTNSFTFSFNKLSLGLLPTHVGIVWTDVGSAVPEAGFDNVVFEAFDQSGNSLGKIGPEAVGDGEVSGQTGEDQFFGAIHPQGISQFTISMENSTDWEVDHLQYGVSANILSWKSDIDGDLGTGGQVTTELSTGLHTITAEVTDFDGANGSDSISIEINESDDDTIAPTVTITMPANGQAVRESFTVLGTADDNVGVELVTVSIDGGTAMVADGTEAWSFKLADLTDGGHDIVVTATDAAGNSDTAAITTNVDSTVFVDIQLLDEEWNSGEKIPVVVKDANLNRNSQAIDVLNLFNPDVDHIPTLQTGAPITLEKLKVASLSGTDVFPPTSYPKTVEEFSQRVFLEASGAPITLTDGDSLVFKLDTTFEELYDTVPENGVDGFNGVSLINYDVRSIFNNADIDSVTVKISDGTTDVELASGADAQGLIVLDSSKTSIPGLFDLSEERDVDLIFEFDTNDTSSNIIPGTVMPVVVDFFSFGFFNDGTAATDRVANQIIRLELEETEANTGVFAGSLEYTVINQLNILDEETYEDLSTIADDPTFIVIEDLTDDDAPRVNYLEIIDDGVPTRRADQEEAPSHSGIVSFDSNNYKVTDTITITLEDQDLNTDSDLIEIYTTVSDPTDAAFGSVGEDGLPELSFGPLGRLLDITFDDVSWRTPQGTCDLSGTDDTGLDAITFSLVETGAETGVFIGSFDIPDRWCRSDDGNPETTTGLDIEVNYVDFRDASGEIVEVGDSAGIRTNTGSVSLDRTIYPVPFGVPSDFGDLSGEVSPDNKSIFPIHQTGISDTEDGDLSNDGKFLSAGDLQVHIRINDPDFDISSTENNVIAQNTSEGFGPLKISVVRGTDTVVLGYAGGEAAENGQIIDVSDNPTKAPEFGPIKEMAPDSGIFELDLTVRYTDGPADPRCPDTEFFTGFFDANGDGDVQDEFDRFATPSSDDENYCILQGDILQVEYTDPATGVVTTDSASFNLRDGVLTVDQLVYPIGSDLAVTLTDPDLDLDSQETDTLDIDLIEWDSNAGKVTIGDASGAGTDFSPISVILNETAPNSGIFTAVVQVPSAIRGTALTPGEVFALQFTDWGPASANFVGAAMQSSTLTLQSLDDQAPIVVSVTPENGATNVAVGQNWEMRFNEALNPSTVNNTTVSLQNISVTPVVTSSTSVSYDPTQFRVIVDPIQNLASNTQYRLTVTNGVTDAAGNSAQPVQVTATTADTQGPVAVAFNPEPGATNVAADQNWEVTFNEPLDASTVNNTTVSLQNISVTPVVTSSTSVSYDPTQFRVIVDPIQNLASNTQYRLTVTNGVTDAAGNSAQPVQVTATTADTAGPVAVAFNPEPGETNVATDQNWEMRFNEALNPSTVNNTTVSLQNISVTPVVTSSTSVSYDPTQFRVIVDPIQNLASNTQYRLTVTNGVTDAAGNSAQPVQVTATTADTQGPVAVAFNPEPGATNVAADQNWEVTFNEPLDASTVNNTTVSLQNISVTPVVTSSTSISYDPAQFKVIVDPTQNLDSNTQYQLTVTPSVTDTSGNSAQPVQVIATTGADGGGGRPLDVCLMTGSYETDFNCGIVKLDVTVNPDGSATVVIIDFLGTNPPQLFVPNSDGSALIAANPIVINGNTHPTVVLRCVPGLDSTLPIKALIMNAQDGFGNICQSVMISDEDDLVNLDVFDPGTGVLSVRVPCLQFEGQRYPLYQFHIRNSLFDICPPPHWHADGMVFPVESPNTGILDPDAASCGFGVVGEIPLVYVTMSLADWELFLLAHPPQSH